MRSISALAGALLIASLLSTTAVLAEESDVDLTKSLTKAWLGTGRDRLKHREWEPAARAFREVLLVAPANEEAIEGLWIALL